MDRIEAFRRRAVARRLEQVAHSAELELDTVLSQVELPATWATEIRTHASGLRSVAKKLNKSAARAYRKLNFKPGR